MIIQARLTAAHSRNVAALFIAASWVLTAVPEAQSKPDMNPPAPCILHLGGCQNYGPFLGPYCDTAPSI